MTQGKHTPGPWKVDSGEALKVRNNSGSIATIMQTHLTGRRSNDETMANARLIAAAPDMLEALSIARAEIVALERDMETLLRGDFVKGRTHEETGDPLLVVEAAIARATGEKP